MSLRPAGLLLVLLAGPVLLTGCAGTPEPMAPPEPMAEVPSLLQPEPKIEIAAIPAPPPTPPAPRFAGHVASYKTLAEAEAAWPHVAERYPVLKTADRRYVEIDLGGQRGKVVRLLVGGFADRAAALSYCHELRAAKLFCAPHELPTS
ncbi:MAG: SPOR domain-containing protein [Ferrovibrio sp.]